MKRRHFPALAAATVAVFAVSTVGAPVAKAEFNWQDVIEQQVTEQVSAAHVRVMADGNDSCSATVVADQWVLTAAACVEGAQSGTVLTGEGASMKRIGIRSVAVAPASAGGKVALVELDEPSGVAPLPVDPGEPATIDMYALDPDADVSEIYNRVSAGWTPRETEEEKQRAWGAGFLMTPNSGPAYHPEISVYSINRAIMPSDLGGMVASDGKLVGVMVKRLTRPGFDITPAAEVATPDKFDAWMRSILNPGAPVEPGNPGSLDIFGSLGDVELPSGSADIALPGLPKLPGTEAASAE